MFAASITPAWIIEELRRDREQREERQRPRVELPVQRPVCEDTREDDRRSSTVIIIQAWGRP
jgi:hypothetical protein